MITSHVLVDLELERTYLPAARFFKQTLATWRAAAADTPPKLVMYVDRWQPDYLLRGEQPQVVVTLPGKRTCMGGMHLWWATWVCSPYYLPCRAVQC